MPRSIIHANSVHGHSTGKPGGAPTTEYTIWCSMRQRCNNPSDAAFKYYGGRGIRVCERWGDFRNFLADMGSRPKGLWLDRINNDGDYEPSNCKWSTPKEQANNRRSSEPWLTRTGGYQG